MKSSIFWVMFATASLLGCGKSEETAVSQPIQEVPQQVETAPVASSQIEPVLAQTTEPVAVKEITPPTQAKGVAPTVPAKSTQPIAAKPVPAVPAVPAVPVSPAAIAVEATPVAPKPDLARGQQVYRQSCAVCHDKGIAGAPKPGNTTFAQGLDVLYKTALQGKGAMPAKGGNPSLADSDVKAAVDYMAAQSR